jgi:hypothetical protein
MPVPGAFCRAGIENFRNPLADRALSLGRYFRHGSACLLLLQYFQFRDVELPALTFANFESREAW